MFPDRDRTNTQPFARLVLTSMLLASAALALPRPVSAASVFPSRTPDGLECQVTLTVGVPGRFYVLASGYPFLPDDPPLARQGITGAEFRIDGLPPGWLYIVEPPEGGTIEGNFFGTGGRITFPECRPWETASCLVLLLDITVIATSVVGDGTFVIQPPLESCNPSFESILRLCDGPTPTALCTPTQGMCFNVQTLCAFCPLSRPASGCTLPVEAATWSGVKALFHETGSAGAGSTR